jgi:predicted nucleotidyltransferase
VKLLPTVSEIIEKKNKRKRRLQNTLERLKIILFGSFLRDEIDVYSDLDLLVIMPSNMTGKEWMNLIYETIEVGTGTDIIVYNFEEFNDKRPTSSFLDNIIKNGKVIYEKT